jgi:hypothetical protein
MKRGIDVCGVTGCTLRFAAAPRQSVARLRLQAPIRVRMQEEAEEDGDAWSLLHVVA